MMTRNSITSLFVAATVFACLTQIAVAQQSSSADVFKATSPSIDNLDPSLVESEMIEGTVAGLQQEQSAINTPSSQDAIFQPDRPIQNSSFGQNQFGNSPIEGNTTQRTFNQPVVDRNDFGPQNFSSRNVYDSGTNAPDSSSPIGIQPQRAIASQPSAITSMPINNGSMTESRIAPTIQTQILAPRKINVHQPAEIYLQAQNISQTDVKAVRLIAELPDHVKFEGSNPLPTSVNGRTYEFTLDNLGARSKRIVRINLIPTAKLPLNIATQIQTESQQQIAVEVQQPVLDIAISGPEAIQTGHEVRHTITVRNIGDGTAENIRIKPLLSDNLQFSSNQKTLVPKLVPGQATKFILSSYARSAGDSNVVFQVSASGIESRETRSNLRIIRPELGVQLLGPSKNFLGREGVYSIQLDNNSELPINNIDVTMQVPNGLKITTISQQAKVDQVSGTMTWRFKTIPGKQQQIIQFKAESVQAGDQSFDVMVTSKEIGSKQLALTTRVQGRADLSLRLSDGGEPVGIGAKSEFTIEVANHGSTIANQVNVQIQLPEALMAVSQENYTIDPSGSFLQFNSIDIAPGRTETLKFKVVAVSEGEHIVRGTVSIEGSSQTISSENSIFVFESQNAKVSESLTPEIRR